MVLKLKFKLSADVSFGVEYRCFHDGFNFSVRRCLDQWQVFRGTLEFIEQFSTLESAFNCCQEECDYLLNGGVRWRKTPGTIRDEYFGSTYDNKFLFQTYRTSDLKRFVVNTLSPASASCDIKELAIVDSLEQAKQRCAESLTS